MKNRTIKVLKQTILFPATLLLQLSPPPVLFQIVPHYEEFKCNFLNLWTSNCNNIDTTVFSANCTSSSEANIKNFLARQKADFGWNFPHISAVFVQKYSSMAPHPPWYKPILLFFNHMFRDSTYFPFICCWFSAFCSIDLALVLSCRVDTSASIIFSIKVRH